MVNSAGAPNELSTSPAQPVGVGYELCTPIVVWPETMNTPPPNGTRPGSHWIWAGVTAPLGALKARVLSWT